jgi:hypothetical protein
MGLFDFALKEKKEEEKEQLGSGFGGGWGLSDLVNEKKKKELSPNVTGDIGAGANVKAEGSIGKFDFALKIPDVETIKQKEQALVKAEETFSSLDKSIETNYKRYQELGQQLDDLEVELQEAPEELKWNLSLKYENLRTEHNKLVDQLKTETEQQKKVYKEYNTIRDNYEKDIQRYNKKAEAQNKLAQEQHQSYLDTSRLGGSMARGEELPKTREQELKDKFTTPPEKATVGGMVGISEPLDLSQVSDPVKRVIQAIGGAQGLRITEPELYKQSMEIKNEIYKYADPLERIAKAHEMMTGEPMEEALKELQEYEPPKPEQEFKPTWLKWRGDDPAVYGNSVFGSIQLSPKRLPEKFDKALGLVSQASQFTTSEQVGHLLRSAATGVVIGDLALNIAKVSFKAAPEIWDKIKNKDIIKHYSRDEILKIWDKVDRGIANKTEEALIKSIAKEDSVINAIKQGFDVKQTVPRFAPSGGTTLYSGLPADEIAKMIVETGKVTADVVKGLDPVQVSQVTQQLLNTAPALASEFLKAVEKPEVAISGAEKSDLIEEAKKYGSAEEFIKSQQPEKITLKSAKNQQDYMGGHEAPMAEDINAPVWDLTGKYTGNDLYPKDIYSADASRLYSSGSDYDQEAISILHSIEGKPNSKIAIYRAIPKNMKAEINAGDWVTLTKGYAKEHGESNLNGEYKIVKKVVSARDLFTDANSLQEFGYDPQPRLKGNQIPFDLLKTTFEAEKAGKKTIYSGYVAKLTDIYNQAKREAIAKEEVSLPQKAPEPPLSEGEKGDLREKIFYHGTTKQKAENIKKEGFQPTENIRQLGPMEYKVKSGAFFFSDDKNIARNWANNRAENPSDIDILEVKLDIKKPFDMTDSHFMEWEGIELLRDNLKIPDNILESAGIYPDELEIYNPYILSNLLDEKIVVDGLKKLGYDGAIVPESGDEYGEKSYAVFSKEQIKPAPATEQSSEAPRVPQKETQQVIKEVTKAPEEQLATPEQVQEVKTLGKDRKLIIKTKQGNISDNRFKRLAKAMTGKTNPEKMTPDEIEEFKYAIEQVVQRQPWEPPIIPVSTKIVPKDFFEDLQFKEPNIFKFVTPKEHLLRSMGVESLVKDLTEAKKEAYLKGIDANNFIDNTIKDINRKAPKFEKIKKKVFNQPTERVANFRDLLDKYETAPDYLNDKDKEIFNKLRKFTNEMLSDVNVVRERLGLDPIKKLNAYVPHFLDELAKQIVQKKYPFPEDVKYWLGRNMPKKIYNPTEMERRVSKELTDVFSKDLGKLLKVMSRYDLRDIYLSQPYSILRAKLNALGDKIPASVRKEIDDYIRYDIFEYPDELDNLFNNLVKTPTELINFFLRPFGRIVTNPAKAVSGIMRRGLMGGAIAARPKLIIRNLFQRLLLMDLYQPKYFLKAQLMPTPKRIKDLIDNSKFWKLSTKQGFEDIPKEGFSIEEKALAPYGWSHKSNVSVSMKTGAYFAEEMVKLSENPNSRFYKYAEKFAKEKGVSLDKLLWNKDDILLEAEDAGAYAQWLYYATGMPQIYRGQIKRLAFSLQSWSLNYFFKHVPEMITRTFTGRTSRGKLLRPIDRLNAIKGLAIIAGITYGLKELGDYAYDKYLLPWGIALNANIVSPAGQVFGGIINYVTAYNDWERVKAEKQIKDAWKLFIPGSLAYKDFTDWLNGNKSLDESLFYKDYRRINEKELNKTTKTKRTGSKTTTTKKKRATK